MKNVFFKLVTTAAAASLVLAALPVSADEEAKEIKVAVAGGFYPITYADDNGEAQGYDVEVFKAVDELLPQYTFTYEITDKETMNVGVQSGTYQVGINSLLKNDARTATYYMPENNVGYTPVGIIHREGEEINSFDDALDQGLKPYLVNASGGIRFVYDDWNANHPDKQIEYTLNTEFSYADLFASIRSGDYDWSADLIPVFNLQDKDTVAGLVISDPVAVVPTYPIVNQSETELGDAINEALGTLKEDGTLSKLSEDVFGYDVFALAEEDETEAETETGTGTEEETAAEETETAAE